MDTIALYINTRLAMNIQELNININIQDGTISLIAISILITGVLYYMHRKKSSTNQIN
ncbi:hypothetical protein [Sulfurimonas sp. C5]|uniref:hypothetical protein n=1 Tax=Sulfurimonas sp. C5 TaxID=3036947 RepID=UPI0024559CDA|nr:hypothetical protein [Sulfurimonas sp. C5]MDH4944886.1 hypothetical protein [Sulfurimonas sp. C5]